MSGKKNTFFDFFKMKDDDEFDDDDLFDDENADDDYEERSYYKRNPSSSVGRKKDTYSNEKYSTKYSSNKTSSTPRNSSSEDDKLLEFSSKKKDKGSTRLGVKFKDVHVIKAKSLVPDAITIIDLMMRSQVVIINMNDLEYEEMVRIIDNVAGAAFALRGTLERIEGYIYIVLPPGIEISGELAEKLIQDVRESQAMDTF